MNNTRNILDYNLSYESESKLGITCSSKSNKVKGDINIISPLMRKQALVDSQYIMNGKISLFTSDNKKDALPIERILNDLISRKGTRDEPEKTDVLNGCMCYKSKCLKKYCLCYSSGIPCGEHCKCSDCYNKQVKPPIDDKQVEMTKGVFCTCTKSKCIKQYCECYKLNKECGITCRCINCLNKPKKGKKGNIKHISIEIKSKVINVTENEELFDVNLHDQNINDKDIQRESYKSLLFIKPPVVNKTIHKLKEDKTKMFKVHKRKGKL